MKNSISITLLELRHRFWLWILFRFPKVYGWFDRHLPLGSLPF